MKAQFTFLSGSRTGQTDIFSQAHISIGRHPQSELRFDADKYELLLIVKDAAGETRQSLAGFEVVP